MGNADNEEGGADDQNYAWGSHGYGLASLFFRKIAGHCGSLQF
jgi:hypothetical protein